MGDKETKLDLFAPKALTVLYLIIGIIPRFEAVDPIGSQWFYFSIVNLLGLFYIYANRDEIAHFKKQKHLIAFFGFYLLFFISSCISLVGAINFSEGVKDISRIVIAMIGAMNLFLIFKIAPKRLFEFIVKVSHIIVVIISIQVLYVFLNDISVSRNSTLLKETALTYGTQNATAASLAIQIPFLLWGLLKHTSKWKVFSIISLVIGVSALLLIGARTAVLSAMVYSILFIIYLIVDGLRKKHSINYTKIFVLPFIGIVLVSYFFAININRIDESKPNTFNDLVFAPVKGTSNKTKKSFITNASGRMVYYEMALDDFKSKPLKGVGIGNWKLSNKDKFFASAQRDKFIYPLRVHNDFLQILAEVGVLGFLSYVFIFLTLIFCILKLFFRNQNSDDRWIYVIIIFALLGYGLDALINFPLERTPIQGHFVSIASLILAFFYTENKPENTSTIKLKLPILIAIGFFGISTTIISFVKYKSYVTQNYVLADTSGKNLMKDSYVYSYDKIVKDLSGFFNIAGVGRPNEHVKGMYAMSEGRIDKALAHLDKSIAQAPNHYESKMLKGIIYGQRKIDNDSAIFYAKQGFEKYPSIKNNYVILLNAYRAKGDTINYFKTFDKRLTLFPDDISQWKLKSERIMEFYDDTDRAMAVIDEALVHNPDDSSLLAIKEKYTANNNAGDITAWYSKAFDYIREQKYKEAKEEFLKILKVTPSNTPTLLNLGIIEIKLKQYDDVILHLTKVINSKKYKDGRAEYNRGLAYERLGQKEKAARDYSRSKKLGYKLALKLPESKLK